MNKYSIIIPTLNEEKYLPEVLKHLKQFKEDFEIIITDGGSDDDTIKVARSFKTNIVNSKRGKGLQLNAGTHKSSGEILIYLHADTYLPGDAFTLINEYFLKRKIDIATFKMRFDISNMMMEFYSWFTGFDSMFTTYGDQVIVINRNFYNEIGGFPEIPLFEDVELLKNARRKTKIHKLPSYVTTSARRFEKHGFFKTQLLNVWYHLQYLFGVSSERIYKKYFKDKL